LYEQLAGEDEEDDEERLEEIGRYQPEEDEYPLGGD